MYAELIDQTISQVYQKGVVSKILQGMDRIRNEFDPVQARRWPTEPRSAQGPGGALRPNPGVLVPEGETDWYSGIGTEQEQGVPAG